MKKILAKRKAQRAIPRLLNVGRFLKRARAARHLVLLLDYDGTLREIAPRPQDAMPDAGLLDLLRRLVRRPRTTVAIVSGRPLKDLTRIIPVRGLSWIGTHGLELRPAGGRVELTADVSKIVPAVRALRNRIRPHLDASFTLEDKRVSLSLHTRVAAPRRARAVSARFAEYFEDALGAAPQLEMIHGKEVYEVRMRGVDKGTGARRLLDRHAPRSADVSCAGDDRTDEDMFRAVNALGGETILVGSRPSLARRRLPTVSALRRLLEQLL